MRGRWVGWAVGLAAGMACQPSSVFLCSTDADCNSGFCEATKYCSFPDDTCETGHRYGELAGDGLAGQCTEPGGTSGVAGTTSGTGGAGGTIGGGSGGATGQATGAVDTQPLDDGPITISGGSSTDEGGSSSSGGVGCGQLDQACCDGACNEGDCLDGTCVACTLSVEAMEHNTCGWRTDGTLACWGRDNKEQLGDGVGTAVPQGTPASVGLAVADVGLGAEHACAVGLDGAVSCWGDNYYGQLGPTAGGQEALPVSIGVSGTQIDGGYRHTCVVDSGSLTCWGRNNSKQSAPDEGAGGVPPTLVDVGDPVAFVGLGYEHSCGITNNAVAFCFGQNSDSQSAETGGTGSVLPTSVALDNGIVDIDGADTFTCAVDDTGGVWCWGRNDKGQLGNNGGNNEQPAPELVAGVDGIVQVATGVHHTCVRSDQGEVWCWGANNQVQLGDPTAPDGDGTPVQVDVGPATDIAAGRDHTCIVESGTAIVCWGSNNYGQLGIGSDNPNQSAPVTAMFDCQTGP